jgi:hypothetical protein
VLREGRDDLGPSALSRPLFAPTDPTRPIVGPVVCLLTETGDGPVYATARALGSRGFDELVREGAAEVVRSSPVTLTEYDEPTTLVCLYGEHASETLLIERLRRQLHALLRSKSVALGLPVRGVVMACALDDAATRSRLEARTRRTHDAAGAQGLYPGLLCLESGEITGPVEPTVKRATSTRQLGGRS